MFDPMALPTDFAQLNDSGTFESSFDIKYLQTTPSRTNNKCGAECDRQDLLRFVREFEQLQANNTNAKSTPKNSPYLCRKARTIYENIFIALSPKTQQRCDSPSGSCNFKKYVVLEDEVEAELKKSMSDLQLGLQPLTKCSKERESDEEYEDDDGISSNTSSNCLQQIQSSSSSADSSFEMQPPLIPVYKVTPPKAEATKYCTGSRNAAYEFARFLRGSFHVRKAKVTHLSRSLSEEAVHVPQSYRELKKPLVSCKTTNQISVLDKPKKPVLTDATNRCKGNTIRVSHF